jgi:excisionase family DNA binding protein
MSLNDLIHSRLAVITQTQAAQVLGCDQRTVSAGVTNNSIPNVRIGSRYLIPVGPFCEFLGVHWVGGTNGN